MKQQLGYFRYEFSPVKFSDGEAEKCSLDEAQAFGLYLIVPDEDFPDGLPQHIADFETSVCMVFPNCANKATTGFAVTFSPYHVPSCERCKARMS